MKLAVQILGGSLAALLGSAVVAETTLPLRISEQVAVLQPAALRISVQAPDVSTLRPLSREDARALRAVAELRTLAGFRPSARPTHMLRYPVVIETAAPSLRPLARRDDLPVASWDHRDDGQFWTRAALSALSAHGGGIEEIVPRDIAAWCPAYPENSLQDRRDFWMGMMSALAKHESHWNPEAVGGGDLWYGLLQIYPDTAQRYGCRARSGVALTDPGENLSCAARIMAVTVRRDRAIAVHDGRWRGVAADWGPMTESDKRVEMQNWTRQQSYCRPGAGERMAMRPAARPDSGIEVAAQMRPVARPFDPVMESYGLSALEPVPMPLSDRRVGALVAR